MYVNKSILIFILIISSLSFIIRFHRISADPDTSVTWSGAFFTDEGFYSTNAVKKILTGHFICDHFNHILVMPVMSFLQYYCLEYFGLSLFSIRFPSLLLSTLTILLFIIFIILSYRKKHEDLKVILPVSVFIFCTNYIYLIYSRVAFWDIPMFTFGFISLIFLFLALKSNKIIMKQIFYILSGLFLSISVLTKTTGGFFYIIVVLIFVFQILDNKFNNRKILKIADIYGILLLLIVSLVVIILTILFLKNKSGEHFINIFRILVRGKITLDHLKPIIILKNYSNLFLVPFIWKNIPLFILTLLSIWLIIYKFIKKRVINLIDTFFISILLATILFFGFFGYAPSRYLVVLTIPVSYFIGIFLIRLKEYFIDSGKLIICSKKHIFSIILIAIIILNGWNIIKTIHYFFNLRFSINDLGEKVSDDIYTRNSEEKIIVCGRYTSLLALLGVNKTDIYYDFTKLDNNINYSIFILETNWKDSPLKVFQKTSCIDEEQWKNLEYITKYNVLNNFHNIEFRLYRLIE